MDPEGFEPVRSPLVRVDLLNGFKNKNGPRGIRTPDLLNAIETRSQLRYGPGLNVFRAALRAPNPPEGGCVRYGPVITVVA